MNQGARVALSHAPPAPLPSGLGRLGPQARHRLEARRQDGPPRRCLHHLQLDELVAAELGHRRACPLPSTPTPPPNPAARCRSATPSRPIALPDAYINLRPTDLLHRPLHRRRSQYRNGCSALRARPRRPESGQAGPRPDCPGHEPGPPQRLHRHLDRGLERKFGDISASAAYVATSGIGLGCLESPTDTPVPNGDSHRIPALTPRGEPRVASARSGSSAASRTPPTIRCKLGEKTSLRAGLGFQASYTFSKSIDDTSAVLGGLSRRRFGNTICRPLAQNPRNGVPPKKVRPPSTSPKPSPSARFRNFRSTALAHVPAPRHVRLAVPRHGHAS